jgi:hypothetical protein
VSFTKNLQYLYKELGTNWDNTTIVTEKYRDKFFQLNATTDPCLSLGNQDARPTGLHQARAEDVWGAGGVGGEGRPGSGAIVINISKFVEY